MHKWWKRILAVFLFALLVPLLLMLFLVFEHVRGRIALARYKRALIAKGEKLSPPDFVTPSTNGENSAPELFAAISELREGTVLPKRLPPRMQVVPSGRAIAGFREDEWIEDKATNDWFQVLEDIRTNSLTFDRIRAALAKPVFDNKVDLSRASAVDFSHLSKPKHLAGWLGAGSQLFLHDDKTHKALDYLLPEIGLPRVLSEDNLVISELVRMAIAGIARCDTWEAMQAEDWNDEDLGHLQSAWENQHFVSGLIHGLEGEVVFQMSSYESCRKSNEATIQSLYGLDEYLGADESDWSYWERLMRHLGIASIANFLKKQVYCRIWRFAWLDQDECRNLEYVERLLRIARDAETEKSEIRASAAVVNSLSDATNKNLYDQLKYPDESAAALSRTISRAMHAETDRSLTICAIALKRYALRHESLPDSLDALTPELLSSVPVDYMDGKPLKYRLNADKTFTLYSVGEDGKDDGGDTSLPPDKTSSKNLWYRKDCVWPAPALPEEIEAFRKEAAKH